MSKGHDDLTGPLACAKCHEGGTGVPDQKCLGCHAHRDMRQRIEAGKGFHSDPDLRKKACKDCHAEHKEEPPGSGKGRRTTVDWRPFGGKRNFAHQRTGWPLEGAHRFQKCESCHKKTSPRTDQTIFLGLRSECTNCHKSPHQFDDPKLSDCTICHSFDTRRVASLGATRFDHDKTRFPLEGNHTKQACAKCHTTTKVFTIKDRKFDDCSGCHKDSHRSVISATRKCQECHSTKVLFEKTRFDHAKNTRFPLRGQHARNRCKDCHRVDGGKEKPPMQCAGCHEDVHRGRFGKEPCEGCHVEADKASAWKEIVFDHDKKTRFELTGAHTQAKCVECHRNKEPKGFERFETAACASCHRHQDAHCGQFGMENCERCHVQGGDRTSRFDHSLTRFKLEGAHAKPACDRCHKPARLGDSPYCKRATKYTGLDPQCLTCHEDIHKGELGRECAKCHTGGSDFKTLAFDHNRDSTFPLTGFHQIVECASCHPNRHFKIGEKTCFDCHQKDDAHAKVLGDECQKCHETTGGAPKFDHDIHTKFVRRGVHAKIECQRCHFLPAPKTKEREALGLQFAAIAPPGAPVDLQFRAAGKACTDCHPDPHRVRADVDCLECHGYEAWTEPKRNGYHERAGFSLTGAHTVMQCGLCHRGPGQMTGRGEQCGTCHLQDDIHAGAFGNDCGRCHEQLAWLPTRFTHDDVGYVLEGVHKTLDCRSCHLAGNYFIGKRCYNCHLDDFRNADWHKAREITAQAGKPKVFVGGVVDGTGQYRTNDCGDCHNQFTFLKGTYLLPPMDKRGRAQQ